MTLGSTQALTGMSTRSRSSSSSSSRRRRRRSRGQPTRGGPPAWGLGEVLTIPHGNTFMLRNTHMRDDSSGDKTIKSRRMRWAGHVARMGEERGLYRVLVGKPEGKRPLGRPRRRWVDNIRMDLQEVGCRYMDWIGLAQGRDRWRTLVSAVMNLRVP